MRIHKSTIVIATTVVSLLTLAGPAAAGGRPTPAPGWMGSAFVIGLLVVGAFFLAIVAVGIAQRRRDR